MRNLFLPIFIFVSANIFGFFYGFLTSKDISHFTIPNIKINFDFILNKFQIILFNNILVFLVALFTIRFIIFFKNIILKDKARYTKVDQFMYHLINSVILIKTGFSVGFLVYDLGVSSDYSFLDLYIKGILPHGILEMIPFIIVFYLNYHLIKNKNWHTPLALNFKKISFLGLIIILAALVEATITPILFYS